MTIYALKSQFQGILRPATRPLHSAGVTANQVTVFSCFVSIAIGAALVRAEPVWFAAIH